MKNIYGEKPNGLQEYKVKKIWQDKSIHEYSQLFNLI